MKPGDLIGWPGVAVATVIVVGGAVAFQQGWIGSDVTPPEAPAMAAAPADAKAPSEADPRTQDATAQPVSAQDRGAAGKADEGTVPAADVATLVTPPSFDIVRVEPDGSALIAGAASPDWDVSVLLDGTELDRPVAGRDGRFVSFIDVGHSDKPRVMTLEMHNPAGQNKVASKQQIILAPTSDDTQLAANEQKKAQEADVVSTAPGTVTEQGTTAAPMPGAETPAGTAAAEPAQTETGAAQVAVVSEVSAAPVQTAGSDTTTRVTGKDLGTRVTGKDLGQALAKDSHEDTGQAPEVTAQAPETPVAQVAASGGTTVLLADASGVRVLQKAGQPEVQDNVLLDSISYDDAGDVVLSGRGTPGAFVRIYLDDTPVTTSRISDSGAWESTLPHVDTGIYRLRVDEVDEGGTVLSRVETPFKRESQILAEEMGASAVSQVTVQPGSTLWAIARQNYGEGILYVRVFDANRDLIRNPDLIYPGQIFTVPRLE